MFSVIIPLYNKAPYIEKAIQSVLAQTYQEFELIIVDDGSTDGSLEIVKQLQVTSYKLQVLEQANSGVSTARNNGVKAAKYDYIAFLDADDWWEMAFLEEMQKLIEKYPDNGIWASGHYNYRYGILKECEIKGLSGNFVDGKINYAVIAKYGNKPICTGAVVLDKTCFLKERGFNLQLKLGEDFDLYFRVSMKYGMALLNKPLAVYNNDVDIATRAVDSSRLYEMEEHFAFHIHYDDIEYDENVKYLLDFLKLNAFFKYYINKLYLNEINRQLEYVNWKDYHWSYYFRYRVIPISLLKLWNEFKRFGSRIKQRIKK